MEVNIHEAKSTLSKLIEKACSGQEVIIAKAGTPKVRLVPVEQPRKPVFGSAKGLIKMKKGWDAPLTDREIDELFLGE